MSKTRKRKNEAAVALGKLGGKAAAGAGLRSWRAGLTPEERSEIARKAARKRWGKRRRKKGDSR